MCGRVALARDDTFCLANTKDLQVSMFVSHIRVCINVRWGSTVLEVCPQKQLHSESRNLP